MQPAPRIEHKPECFVIFHSLNLPRCKHLIQTQTHQEENVNCEINI